MPAEQNHQEKCNFTWKEGVLTWESCDGFCRGKTKAHVREGSITPSPQFTSSLICSGWVKQAPTGATCWEQHGEPANLSQDCEKPGPSWGPNRHKKLWLKHTSEENTSEVEGHLYSAWLGWVIRWQSLTWLSDETLKPPKFPKVVLVLAQLWHCFSHRNCVNSGQWCPAPLYLTVARNKGKW